MDNTHFWHQNLIFQCSTFIIIIIIIEFKAIALTDSFSFNSPYSTILTIWSSSSLFTCINMRLRITFESFTNIYLVGRSGNVGWFAGWFEMAIHFFCIFFKWIETHTHTSLPMVMNIYYVIYICSYIISFIFVRVCVCVCALLHWMFGLVGPSTIRNNQNFGPTIICIEKWMKLALNSAWFLYLFALSVNKFFFQFFFNHFFGQLMRNRCGWIELVFSLVFNGF